jgi:hypothetical protein
MKKNLLLIFILLLILSLSNKVTAQTPTIKLRAHLMGTPAQDTDAVVIYHFCGASDGLDVNDAGKLMNTDPDYPNFYAIIAFSDYPGSYPVCIDGLPPLTTCRLDTLGLKVLTSGMYSITASQISDFSTGTQIILIDSALHTKQDLTIDPAYGPFNFNTTDSEYRFYLYFKLPVCYTLEAKITPEGPTSFDIGNSVKLDANNGTNYKYQWQKNQQDITGETTNYYTADKSGSYAVTVSENSHSLTSCDVIVTVNSTVGLQKLKQNISKIEVFPNPANNEMQIKNNESGIKNYDIIISNLTGRTEKSIKGLKTGNVINVNTSDLSPGIYVLKIMTKSGIDSKKLVINRQ